MNDFALDHNERPRSPQYPTHTSPSAIKNRDVGRHILVVDDDELLAGFLKTELEADGFNVSEARDGEDALHVLNGKTRYDLLLLDLNLPKIDGISVLQQVRPRHPRLPVLVLTAKSRVED